MEMYLSVDIQAQHYIGGAPQMFRLFGILSEQLLSKRIKKAHLLMGGGIENGIGFFVGHVHVQLPDEENPILIPVRWDQIKFEDGLMGDCYSVQRKDDATGTMVSEISSPSAEAIVPCILAKLNV